jgi:hypothetical protein
VALVRELGAHEVVDDTQAGRTPVALDASDVEIGTWDAGTETWTVDEDAGDRVRVVARHPLQPHDDAAGGAGVTD